MADQNEERERITLDGSYGAGPIAELTIITKTDGERSKRETFQFPFMLIDWGKLAAINNLNLIQGYEIIKNEKPSALKDLGL
jgi:hypothetical protein